MEKQEIVKVFLNKGFQLDSSSLDFFFHDPIKINFFIEEIDKISDKPSTITLNFVKSILKEKPQIQILKSFTQEQKLFTTEKTIQFFIDRYEKIKKILNGRLDLVNLVSVNKITPKSKKFSIIVMIKEKISDSNSIVVEDLTGELIVRFPEKISNLLEEIVLDEAVGLVCELGADGIVVNNVIWPDLPLRRDVNKTKDDIFCLFISDIHMDSEQFNHGSYEKFLNWLNQTNYSNFYIFVLGGISSREEDVKEFFSKLPKNSEKIFLRADVDPDLPEIFNITPPSLVKLENIVFLLYHGEFLEKYSNIWKNLPAEKIMLNLLKKRHMDPIFDSQTKIFDQDQFVLDIVPDIFVSGHFHNPGILNYKGTTIISNGSFLTQPIFWIINLRTRETFKLDFT
jgi:DNA polymerase II small subunit/DNA polymerase delta subunit B